jgi:signal transduction histidine kinase
MAVDQSPAPSTPATNGAGQLFLSVRRAFVAYARWLDSITWIRFFVLSLLALIATAILSDLPPFSWKWGSDTVIVEPPSPPRIPKVPSVPKAPSIPTPPEVSKPGKADSKGMESKGDKPHYEITVDKTGVHIGPSLQVDKNGVHAGGVTIDKDGVRIGRGAVSPKAAASAASAAAEESPAASDAADADAGPRVDIRLPPNANTDEIRAAVQEAKDAIKEAIAQAAEEEAAADAATAAAAADPRPRRTVIHAFRPGDHMPGLMMVLIVMSMVIKIMAAGRFKAEAQAVEATEIAESEALKRQVVEARMAAMQAQVEPHFLFNTLASIDHLIETDPSRASKMQKNLIALLRASMPTMREANAQGTRDLGRELAVIRPYLEILKVRMEERLRTDVRVPEGLLSADFPPMMLQGLVENAIKHGLEPKAEGGSLTVSAEIVHGKLAVTVADTGLGFGKAATAGTGIGLSNIRERLQLLYGRKASLVVTENPGGGTVVTITVPYATSHHQGEEA